MRISERSGGLKTHLALCLVAMLIVACVGVGSTPPPGGTPGGSPPASGGTSSTDAPPTPTEPTPDPGGGGDDPGQRFVAWLIGLLPGTPSLPDQVNLYLLIQKGTRQSCEKALTEPAVPETEPIYRGVAAACLAVLTGNEDRWAQAQREYDAIGEAPLLCMDKAVFDALGSALAEHQAHPNATFKFQSKGRRAVDLPCPTITDVAAHRNGDTIEIVIDGKRLGLVDKVTYRVVDECPRELADVLDNSVDPTHQEASSITAVISDDPAAADAHILLVGLVGDLTDWVTDAKCAPVVDTEPSEAPPTEAPPSLEP